MSILAEAEAEPEREWASAPLGPKATAAVRLAEIANTKKTDREVVPREG